MHFLRYAWYACPISGSLLYLAVYARKRCLAQWQIARPRQVGREEKPGTGIWQQVAEIPPPTNAASLGRCTIPGTATAGTYSQRLQQGLANGRLLLQLLDPVTVATNTYSLIRVRTGGTAWLFGEVFYVPQSLSIAIPRPVTAGISH